MYHSGKQHFLGLTPALNRFQAFLALRMTADTEAFTGM